MPSSLQMSMASLSVGNAPQQMFVSGIQAHALQQQTLMHQGQGFGFGPAISQQLGPQIGNMGIGMGPQFPSQQPGKFSGPGPQRKTTVKITHPDTHEELKLDKRTESVDAVSSGQRQLPSVNPQSQPIPQFNPSHQMNFYSPLQPNSYNPSPIYFPTASTVPLTSSQMPTGSQAPRYSYPVNQSAQPINFMGPSVLNPMSSGKPGPPVHLHGISEGVNMEGLQMSGLSSQVQVTVRAPPVTISMPSSKSESPKMSRPSGDATKSLVQRDGEALPETSVQPPKAVSESVAKVPIPIVDSSTQQTQPGTSSSSAPAISDADSRPSSAGTDGKKREPVRRSDSYKDHQKKPSKRDARNLSQQTQVN